MGTKWPYRRYRWDHTRAYRHANTNDDASYTDTSANNRSANSDDSASNRSTNTDPSADSGETNPNHHTLVRQTVQSNLPTAETPSRFHITRGRLYALLHTLSRGAVRWHQTASLGVSRESLLV